MGRVVVVRSQVVGYGQTPFGRAEDKTLADLAAQAAQDALESAGVGADAVEAIFVGTYAGVALGRQGFLAAVVASRVGAGSVPVMAAEGACASGTLAFHQAVAAIEAGVHDVVLVVGAEKMTSAPTAEVTSVLASATDTASGSYRAGLTFPGFFALLARRYLHEYGVDADQLADVSVKNRSHGAHNPYAHFQKPITREEALGARPIAEPLRLFDCSPVSDGAAALVVASKEWARAHGAVRPVDILATGLASGPVSAEDLESFVSLPAVVTAADAAFARAGITPADVDVAEVHDCFTVAEWIALEDLGLFERGAAAAATSDGVTHVGGGSCTINPSGGLLSKGHPVGATGAAQLVEIVRQMRGESHNQVDGADVGLAHNVGGTGGVAAITLLAAA
jgi:acetyl-CoA C-acetyltransferase